MSRDAADVELNRKDGVLEQGLQLLQSRLPVGSKVTVVRPLAGGYSDAQVVLCDIGGEPGDVSRLNGQFVLKAGYSTGVSQSQAHNAFTTGLGGFATGHVPELVFAAQDAGTRIEIYEIAGGSLDSARTAEHLDPEDREEVCALAARNLLEAQLTAAGQPVYGRTVGAVMQHWLGDGFPENSRGARARDVFHELAGSAHAFQYQGELLPNPLALLGAAYELVNEELPFFRAFAHGDLHLRNLLARGSKQTRDLDYWLIDINWSEPAPLLYDHAYLELAALLFGLQKSTTARVLPILARVDGEEPAVRVDLDMYDAKLVDLLRGIRRGTLATLQSREQRRSDVWQRQYLFARIAAGLNWAAKSLDDPLLCQAALLSACWAARSLLRVRHAQLWMELSGKCEVSPARVSAGAEPISAADALHNWTPFHQGAEDMDLFLIADCLDGKKELAALAQGKWAAVIDLDSDSDTHGLSKVLLPELEQLRHVSVFGVNQQPVVPEIATNWLMANGWTSRNEPTTGSDEEWRRKRHLGRIRNLVDDTFRNTSNQSAAVLCLRSGQRSRQIDRVVEYIDEVYNGLRVRLDLAQAPANGGFDLDAFLSVIAESLPPSIGMPAMYLPGLDNQRWQLTRADLNRLSVDLEVLHSEVLTHGQSAVPSTDEFWRGRPPTWAELEAWVDVQRDATPELMRDITERIRDHQLYTVHLHHSPGAGGTTLARRVAWNLHRTFPTVVLRNYTDTTVDRIDEIYQQCGFPVLMVAESTVLPQSDREVLRQGLATRNSRAVLLWVNRTNVDNGRKHQLIDPLAGLERGRFLGEYRRRADSDRARRLLDELSVNDKVVPSSKLSPFYFGLCVYDDRFQGVVSYVHNHLERLSYSQREVARFLALVTRYGQDLGLPIHMVRAWLGRDLPRPEAYGEEELSDLLGPDLRHLVLVDKNRLRLLHPLIAEHVLKGEEGTEQYGLGQISIQFIRQVVAYLGEENFTTTQLLSELFIRRTTLESGNRSSDNFSELIQELSVEAGEAVFEELTDRCPKNAHFWNHRGRYHIYRVRGDFQRAESYLLRAVETTRGGDSTHLHTLGMVRRFWVESLLKDAMRGAEPATPERLLATVEPVFDLAMEAFSKAAEIQINEHNWATPIQLIATVIDFLWKASGEDSLVRLMERDTATSEWVALRIAQAETLLENLQSIKPEGEFYKKLSRQLDLLYGDVERLVERWKQLREATGGRETEIAIARTMYAGAGRNWARLSEDDLRTIAEMTEGAVNNGQASDADLRLWFQAYRRLPEYAETSAMERLSWFAANKNSLDANYYLYVLHFLIWYRGDAQDQERSRFYLEECIRLSGQERRQLSFEWLGVENRSHPLVHFSELGKQRWPPSNFWSRPHELERISGIIEEIRSPQSGRIRVADGTLTAFFAPRNAFRKTRDINAVVEFYLGFSYEGLRAWEPTYPGVRPDALEFAEPPEQPLLNDSVSVTSVEEEWPDNEESVEPIVPVPPKAPVPKRPKLDPALIRGLSREHSKDDIVGTIIKLIEVAQAEGRHLGLMELGTALMEILGFQAYRAFLAEHGGKLSKAVLALGFRTRHTEAGGVDVNLP